MGILNDVKNIRLTVDKVSSVKSKLVKIYGDCHDGGFDILTKKRLWWIDWNRTRLDLKVKPKKEQSLQVNQRDPKTGTCILCWSSVVVSTCF